MIHRLSFSDKYQYKDEPGGIRLATVLNYQGNSLQVFAKVDTGAEVCLFRFEDGLRLGVPVDRGISAVFSSLGGSVEAFGHEVTIQTGDLAFQSIVYFAKYPGLARNLLGREGWLRNLRLAIVDHDNTLYLSAYDS